MTSHPPIYIFCDNDGDVTRVYPDENGDAVVIAKEFRTKRAAEAHAESETVRLRKKGYEVDWGCNY